MTLPNRLTVARIILAPLFFVFYFLPGWSGFDPAASATIILIIYAGIEISDFLDGYIARRYSLVTDLGKVLDPFADVMSRMTYFLCFSFAGLMPLWVFLVIMYRELGITFLRMMMMGRGKVVAASIWGKAKAVTYAAAGFLGVLAAGLDRYGLSGDVSGVLRAVLQVVFYLAAAAAVASFLTYLRAAAQEK